MRRLSLLLFFGSLLLGCGGAEKCDSDSISCVLNSAGEVSLETCQIDQFKLIENCTAQGLVCDLAVADCVPPEALCGNGELDGSEECDDSNTDSGDGCDLCLTEPGFSCVGEPSVCSSSCGNGTLETGLGEECDDGNLVAGDNCDASCRIECGDGAPDLNEGCDDGNTISGDGCDAQCVDEFCGDGIDNDGANEECDDGNNVPDDGCESDCKTSKVTAISVGDSFTCALTASKKLRCWGQGSSGQLGYANSLSIGDNELPFVAGSVDVGGPVVQVSAGAVHSCALLEDGSVRCWGFAGGGQLGYLSNSNNIGDNETPASAGPVNIGGAASQIAVGSSHSCALLTNGKVRCWGSGGQGELGYGNSNNIGDDETPASAGDINVGANATHISAGSSLACVTTASDIRCWGAGGQGALGYGNTNTIGDDETPAQIGGFAIGITTGIASGAAHSCVTTANSLLCWGSNGSGQLGRENSVTIGDNESANAIPTDVGGPVLQVDLGTAHSCAILTDNSVRCWGLSIAGRLGDPTLLENIGDNSGEMPPAPVSLGIGAVQISAGAAHTCIVSTQGTVRCWGGSVNGQLGYGNTNTVGDDETPAQAGDVKVF